MNVNIINTYLDFLRPKIQIIKLPVLNPATPCFSMILYFSCSATIRSTFHCCSFSCLVLIHF